MELDLWCLKHARSCYVGETLYINILPPTFRMVKPAFEALKGIPLSKVVLEITEGNYILNGVADAVSKWRGLGIGG
ncbi:hypothetical protein, partial [Thermoanaerobacterium sp. DL9XJH110]|uniref:hypothetical protein n=1 Tax=Thermoanaerobacterium sp. DL9XJH110 TaxID=3386643 RepID=UPI003BB80ACC